MKIEYRDGSTLNLDFVASLTLDEAREHISDGALSGVELLVLAGLDVDQAAVEVVARMDEAAICELVIAASPDGRFVTFEDGQVSGDDVLIAGLESQTGSATLVPTYTFDATEFRESGNAFNAAARKLGLTVIAAEGCEPVQPGDHFVSTEEAESLFAEHRREMRAWRKRRRRLGPAS